MSENNKTDALVLELLKKVEEKKQQIGNAERPSWITNCSFTYTPDTNSRINLQVERDMSVLVDIYAFLTVKRDSHKAAQVALGVTDKEAPFKWLGFTFDAWAADVQTRINGLRIKTKKDELTALEARVNALVSPEQRRAIELEKLVKEIGA